MRPIDVQALLAGDASGELLLLSKPLSFWGGYDPHTGLIIDITHPEHGMNLSGRIIAMREGRGSSSSSSVFVEAARLGMAPAAIILGRADPILTIAGLVAADLYQVVIPIVVLPAEFWPLLSKTRTVQIDGATSQVVLNLSDESADQHG